MMIMVAKLLHLSAKRNTAFYRFFSTGFQVFFITDERYYDGLGIMSDIYLWNCSGQIGLIDLICRRSAQKHLF